MKKLRLSLMALALMAGVAGAFANSHSHKSIAKHRVEDLWQDANSDGTTKIGGNTYDSEQDAVNATGCTGSVTPCATSVASVDGPSTGSYIRFNH